MFSWSVEASCTTSAAKNRVWKLWADPAGWPRWDDGLEWCRLDGPFQEGTKGELKPKGSSSVRFELSSVVAGQSYSDVSFLPLTKLYFTHTLEKISGGQLQIRHHAACKGLLAPILYWNLRRDLKKGMPQSVRRLAEMAEQGLD